MGKSQETSMQLKAVREKYRMAKAQFGKLSGQIEKIQDEINIWKRSGNKAEIAARTAKLKPLLDERDDAQDMGRLLGNQMTKLERQFAAELQAEKIAATRASKGG